MEVEGTTADGHIIEELQLNEERTKNSEITHQPTTSSSPGGFDCNICLDIAVDPVVTPCGHLYCWPCIYKWLQVENSSVQNCPVCKASLSENSLVPLYGRGCTTKQTDQLVDVPSRPRLQREQTDLNPDESNYDTVIHPMPIHRHRHHHHYHVHHHYPYDNDVSSNEFMSAPSSPLGGTSRALGGMAIAVLPWMFRNQSEFANNLQLANPSSYNFNGGSPRMRRQEKEVERSLHQIWLFLSCCALLCLFLF